MTDRRAPPRGRLSGRGWLLLHCGSALASLRANGLRSFLTVLGVVIGVASVIVLVAFGEGAREEITGQIDTLGTNVTIVLPGKLQGQRNFNPMGGMGLSNLTRQDVETVASTPGVLAVAAVTFVGGGVYRGDRAASICFPIATEPALMRIRRFTMNAGRFLEAGDAGQRVCVLGTGVAKDLFETEQPVGREISVNGVDYTVVGVASQRGFSAAFGGDEMEALIYLPLATIEQVTGISLIHRIFVEIDPTVEAGPVLDRVRRRLLDSHGGRDDFSLVGSRELLDMFYKIFSLLAVLLLGITSISLIVGGIGIMNVMLVSVTERTREIGIRKTVGARRGDIFAQFLAEAVTLSMLGGVMGIALAVAVCRILARVLPLKPVITSGTVALAFGVCVVVGIVSGVTPAVVAARKDPIEAIRHE